MGVNFAAIAPHPPPSCPLATLSPLKGGDHKVRPYGVRLRYANLPLRPLRPLRPPR